LGIQSGYLRGALINYYKQEASNILLAICRGSSEKFYFLTR
jgi:hypothetical protein